MSSRRRKRAKIWPRRTRRLATMERLEPRLMLAADTVEPLVRGLLADEIEVSAVSVGDSGNTFATARDLGALQQPQQLREWVGGPDPRDVFRFSLLEESEFRASLTGLMADLDLYLFDSHGQWLAASNRPGRSAESIQTTLDAGTYFMIVSPWRRSFSFYTLSLTAEPLLPPPPELPVEQLLDVPYFGGANEWNLNAVNAPESWAAGFAGQGVTIAVLDTGVDLNHPDLIGNLWRNPGEISGNGIDDDGNGLVDDVFGWDFVDNNAFAGDGHGHGTHVAGTIAAGANGFGATGVAHAATIMPVRVLDDRGAGSSLDVAAGIRYAADNGADIINLSLGGAFSPVIRSAVDYAGRVGSLVLAAAGNEFASEPGYPARFSAAMGHVISVGAHTVADQTASFNNSVGASGAVQVDAPGVGVFSTLAGGRYGRLSGTSMAAPHVAGLAALALSANPQLSATELRSLIVEGALRPIGGSDARGGIDAAVTVAMAAGTDAVAPLSVPASASLSLESSLLPTIFAAIAAIDVPGFSADAMDEESPLAADTNRVTVRPVRESGNHERATASFSREPRSTEQPSRLSLRRFTGRSAAASPDDAWWAAAVDRVLADFEIHEDARLGEIFVQHS
jgi:subtilisin family serine protease